MAIPAAGQLCEVSRELGHGSEDLVRRVYSHLGTVRHRSEVVEFQVEHKSSGGVGQ